MGTYANSEDPDEMQQKTKTKVLMRTCSLMKDESIAECSLWRILQYF